MTNITYSCNCSHFLFPAKKRSSPYKTTVVEKLLTKPDFKKMIGYTPEGPIIEKPEIKKTSRREQEKEKDKKEMPLFSSPVFRPRKYEFY